MLVNEELVLVQVLVLAGVVLVGCVGLLKL